MTKPDTLKNAEELYNCIENILNVGDYNLNTIKKVSTAILASTLKIITTEDQSIRFQDQIHNLYLQNVAEHIRNKKRGSHARWI